MGAIEVLERMGLLSQTSRTDSIRGRCECVLEKMGLLSQTSRTDSIRGGYECVLEKDGAVESDI